MILYVLDEIQTVDNKNLLHTMPHQLTELSLNFLIRLSVLSFSEVLITAGKKKYRYIEKFPLSLKIKVA